MGLSNGVNNMNYTLNPINCISCQHFCWWDGDYCCSRKMRILQESDKGEFTIDILKSLEKNKNCIDYLKASSKITEMYLSAFNDFLKKYQD